MARILVLTICDMCPFFDKAECFSLCGQYGLKVDINKGGDGKHPIPEWCPLPKTHLKKKIGCSQCGGSFPEKTAGQNGFSHCDDHRK